MDGIQEFRIARSEVLDAFARAETKLVTFLCKHAKEPVCPTSPLSQKLDRLGSLKPGPQLPKATLKAVTEAAAAFRDSLALRADVVHSVLRVIHIDEPTALYVNAAACTLHSSTARLMTVAQHEALVKSAKAFAKALTPPSPPQPLPGAKAGP